LHIAQRVQIDAAKQFMGSDVLRLALDGVLGRQDGVADATRAEIKLGQAVIEKR
jgi:hypothetical protein